MRGQLRVKSHTADPVAIGDYGPLVSDDGRVFTVEAVRPEKTVVVVSFKEVRDRTAAEALKGVKLYVDRDALPRETGDDSYFHADLIGLEAVDTAGNVLGRVVAVHDFGAGDLLDVAVPGQPSVLVPFTREVVPRVELDAGRLVVDPPAGLFDKRSRAGRNGGVLRRRATDRAPVARPAAGRAVMESGHDLARQRVDALPGDVSGTLGHFACWQGARSGHMVVRDGPDPRLRYRQAPRG